MSGTPLHGGWWIPPAEDGRKEACGGTAEDSETVELLKLSDKVETVEDAAAGGTDEAEDSTIEALEGVAALLFSFTHFKTEAKDKGLS